MRKKLIAIIALIILAICLVSSIVDFSAGGGLYDEGDTISHRINHIRYAPYIYSEPTVDISLGYTPPKGTLVLYCTYTITDSTHKTVDSSIMMHSPFSSEYIISKILTNLPNDNYTFIINAYCANGAIRTPVNSTFTVDTTFIEPKLTMISPQNQTTYNTNKVDIIYHVNSEVNWSYYAIDSSSYSQTDNWISFNGNITLSVLSEGSHKLAISAKTETNKHSDQPFETQIIYFIINTSEVR